MAKKIFTCLAVIILSLCCSVCFAAEGNNSDSSKDSNVNLGEEITDSLNKTGESIKNVTNDAMNTGRNDSKNNNNNNDNNFRNSGTNYNATRTSVEDTTTVGTTNLSTTTWIWIIMAVVAIIIVAMVWYYAVQDNTKD